MKTTPVVYVIDADPVVRETLGSLIRGVGWRPEMFASAQELLDQPRELSAGCVILEVKSPELSGIQVEELLAAQPERPIICTASGSDVPMTVRAIKAGALEFITKPFCNEVMLTAIESAIEHSKVAVSYAVGLQDIRARYASLSCREREVLELVVKGSLNKLIAFKLGIAEITVKVHRGNAMRKMRAQCLADLINMTATLAGRHGLLDDTRLERSPIIHRFATVSATIRPVQAAPARL
jgi:FixJ family two-component response regulator